MAKKIDTERKIIAFNKKATFEYTLLERIEAGVVLQGTEVKALREGKGSIKECYCTIDKDEVYLINCHISPYSCGGSFNHAPLRKRKLLLKKREIKKLMGKTIEKGLTLIPVCLYFKRGLVKAEIALAKGKKAYDKRESIRKKDEKRDLNRMIKERHKY
ncbi:MAG: SsrA-binding protein SmpB [bacterium]